ncbi:MAG: hypothetical protein HHJ09_02330 [Glaciimonas sp.]|nr:hypothetical protein [Glaciimonas sp.]
MELPELANVLWWQYLSAIAQLIYASLHAVQQAPDAAWISTGQYCWHAETVALPTFTGIIDTGQLPYGIFK